MCRKIKNNDLSSVCVCACACVRECVCACVRARARVYSFACRGCVPFQLLIPSFVSSTGSSTDHATRSNRAKRASTVSSPKLLASKLSTFLFAEYLYSQIRHKNRIIGPDDYDEATRRCALRGGGAEAEGWRVEEGVWAGRGGGKFIEE
jgi:hypothetical protein